MNTSTPVYIAGHRGLVGSALVRALTARGHTNLITRTRAELDLTNQAAVNEFFASQKPEVVFLAAAKVGGIMANNTYRADFIYENIAIATNVIRAAHDHGTAKLINLGSSCIYPKHAPQPMREEHLLTGPLEPTNEPYAIAKIAALKLCRYFHEQYGSNFISAMPTNLYGPGDNFDLETSHVLAALIRKIDDAKKTGGPVPLWGDGSPLREFLHVDDLADALIFLAEHVDASDMHEKVADLFANVGPGREIAIRDLATLIAEVEGYEGEFDWDTSKPNGTPRKLMDSSLMRSLGWEPRISLREGIRSTYEWFKEHGRG
jgi:GDP-L-fucose synthase